MSTITQALKIARDVLELASTIADRVPTRWHELNPSSAPAEHDIGCMVNAQPDGRHGYRLIHDALSAVCSALALPQPSAPSVEPASLRQCALWVVDAYNSKRPDYLLRSIQKLTRALDGTAPTAQPAPQARQVPKIATPAMRAEFRARYREGGFWRDRLDYALDRMLEVGASEAAKGDAP